MIDFRRLFASSAADPRRVLRIVLVLSAVLLALWLLSVSRMDLDGPRGDAGGVAERTDSLRSSLARSDEHGERMVYARERQRGVFSNAATTFVVLLLILGIVWFWSRRQSGPAGTRELFREIGTQPLGGGARLTILEMRGEVWVVSVSSNGSVTLLHRYSGEEWRRGGEERGRGGDEVSRMSAGELAKRFGGRGS